MTRPLDGAPGNPHSGDCNETPMSAYARVLLVLAAFGIAIAVSMNATVGVTAGVLAVIAGVLLDRYTGLCSDDDEAPTAASDRR